MPKISVVIPTLISSTEHLESSLECIKRARSLTKLEFELVIVETATEYLKEYADVYLWERKKTSSTRSINRGMQIASGDMVVVLTNDVFVDDNWLEHLLECFEIPNCGLATLATDQFNHPKNGKILEGIWFGVAMMRKQDAWFDMNYQNSWDDSDIIMRVYLSGKIMYRSHKSIVHHKIGMTLYAKPDHDYLYEKNREYFLKKYEAHQNTRIYKILTRGIIL